MSESEFTAALREELANRAPQGVTAVYLFGSFATGNQRRDSDVDIAVIGEDGELSTLETRFQLEGELEASLRRPVQVTVLNNAPPDLIHRVLRDGVLLFDSDPERRVHFEVSARNAYFDVRPHLKRYRQPTEARHDR